MEGIGFSEIIQYFFQYGPFAILPYLMLFALPRLYKQMKTASRDLKKILKRNIFLYQMLVVVLVVFCVGFWTFSPEGTVYYYGEITDLNPAEYKIESRYLFLKNYTIGTEYIVDWIWKKQKEDNYAIIKLKGEDPITKFPIKKEFEFHANDLKRGRRCRIKYDETDGVLMHDSDNDGEFQPLKKAMGKNESPSKRLKRTINNGPFVPLLYAAAPRENRVDIDKLLNMMQAYSSDIREQAVELVVQRATKERELVIKILQQGFEILHEKAPGAAVQQRRLYNRDYLLTSLLIALDRLTEKWGTNHSRWKGILGTKTFELIAEETNSRNPYIQKLAHTFLSKVKKKVPQMVAGKGVLNSLKKSASVETTKKLEEVPTLTAAKKMKIDIVPNALIGKKKQVLAAAMALKKKDIPFKWGGKNPGKGLDSSGFIAYIFHRAGLLEKPETWWSGKFRKEMGTPRKTKTPEQIGDLLFYTGGYVMLYLGNNKIIGMTPGGIIFQDYREFPSRLIQVNRINYD